MGISYEGDEKGFLSCYHIMGISYRGDEKGFLDFLTLVDERQGQEILVSTFKPKGSRDLKCLINCDAKGVGSSKGKGKRALTLL